MRENDIAMLWKTSGVGLRHRESMVEKPTGPWWEVLHKLYTQIGKGMLVGLAGNRGSGKTQLAAHLVKIALNNYSDVSLGGPPRLCRAMGFFLDIRACFRQGATQSERDAIKVYTSPVFLAIDEMHERGETPWEDRLLNYLIDERYAEKRDTVLISNQKPDELAKQLGPSIVDRMRECGGIIECNWPSFRG